MSRWFCAARYTVFDTIPFVIGPCFGDPDGHTLGGTVFQVEAGGGLIPSLPYVLLPQKKTKIQLLSIYPHRSKNESMEEVKLTSMRGVTQLSW